MSLEDILLLEKRNKDFIDEIKKNNNQIKNIVKIMSSTIKPKEPFTDIIILDIEHTDRKIIQIAIKSIKSQTFFSSLVNPHCKITAVVSNLTGIKQKDCDSSPSFLEIRSEIDKFFTNGPVIVLSHNGRSCDFPIVIEALQMKPYKHLWIDTYHDLGDIFNKKLQDIDLSYSLLLDLHDARVDVELLETLITRYWSSHVSIMIDTYIDNRTNITESTTLENYPVIYLRKILSQYGVTGISNLNKDSLIKEYKNIW